MFRIELKHIHDKRGETVYRVTKNTGLSHNTVAKYISDDVVYAGQLAPAVITLCEYYGVDWRDAVCFVGANETEETAPPETKTPLAAVAA